MTSPADGGRITLKPAPARHIGLAESMIPTPD
jgi:hypothetical protein